MSTASVSAAPTTFARWCKFNLVGAMGMALQLATLALVNHVSRGHYLIASGVAVEAAVIHNFIWHTRYTWLDRRANEHWPSPLLRFHLSNGAVSIIGNLVLMRLLVHTAHLPVLFSNIVAIATCSLLNFALSDHWAFTQTTDAIQQITRAQASNTGEGSAKGACHTSIGRSPM